MLERSERHGTFAMELKSSSSASESEAEWKESICISAKACGARHVGDGGAWRAKNGGSCREGRVVRTARRASESGEIRFTTPALVPTLERRPQPLPPALRPPRRSRQRAPAVRGRYR